MEFLLVMPGLDPGIHQNMKAFEQGWMAGSSPAMTPAGVLRGLRSIEIN
jgi:hypothetical protein